MEKLVVFLWFAGEAEEAVAFYEEVFSELRVGEVLRYGEEMGDLAGTVMTVSFELFGRSFVALNGRSGGGFTEAVSLMVMCEDQGELDSYWEKLLAGGEALACGWVKDRYGVTWQVTPRVLMDWIGDSDVERRGRVMEAMMGMVKLDFSGLRRAYEG